MPRRRPSRDLVIDSLFVIGIAIKGVDALVELGAGIVLLLVSPHQLLSLTVAATAGELAEDPHDLISRLLLHGAEQLTAGAALVGALYLLFHAVVKLAIVAALLRGTSRGYPWAMGALAVFLVVQIVQLVLSPSVGVVVLTVLDAVIIALTWREWRHGRLLRDAFASMRSGWAAVLRPSLRR